MSWTNELYQIYKNNYGKTDEKDLLLPIAHVTANAQIEVTLLEEGEFYSARSITDKKDSVTIIPVTEDSGTRGSGVAPHPFADKLIYIAGDYPQFVSEKADNKKYYQAYMEQLKGWKESKNSHSSVEVLYKYLSKGTLLQDLIEARCLFLDEKTEKLSEKENILDVKQVAALVRFRINYEGAVNEKVKTWEDRSLWESFILYQKEKQTEKQLCYATGEYTPCTYKHPYKIRNAGDKAKLISSSDESGFSYRGRFHSKKQALSVGYDFSQKMHNALKWLIKKQGIDIGSMTVLVWASNLQPLPDIIGNLEDDLEDDFDLLEEETVEQETPVLVSDTISNYRKRLTKAIWKSLDKDEFKNQMANDRKVMIMVLDAATTGRLSISMYEEFEISEFYQSIERWHFETAWNCFSKKEKSNRIRSFSLYNLVDYAYGTEQGDFIECKSEIKKQAILKLLPCVISGRKVPADLVKNLVNKASKPTAFANSYNWRKVLEAACGMIRKTIIEEKKRQGEQEGYEVALDYECTDRDYLYGRLLAVAEVAERVTYEKEGGRTTNASRYFEAFSNRPYQTWGIIYKRLLPYLNRMPFTQKQYYENLIGKIKEQFIKADFENNSKLKPLFLLGYHCQLNEIASQKNKTEEKKA